MFDSNQIEAYRSISAPESLRKAVLEETVEGKQGRNVHRGAAYLAIAACALLLAGLSMLPILGIRGVKITYGDRLLGQNAIAVSTSAQELEVAVMREMPALGIDLLIRDCAPAVFAASGGSICLIDADTGEVLSGTSTQKQMDVKVFWDIPAADTGQAYALEIRDSRVVYQVILTFDAEADSWMICQKKNRL